MQNENYVKEQKILETTELEANNRNFEYAQDDLVDYYTYQIKANQAKLNHLIKLAKAKGIEVDMVNDLRFSICDEEAV